MEFLDLGGMKGVLVMTATGAKDLHQAFGGLPLPLGHERGMNLILGREFRDGALTPQGFKSHLGLERGAVVGALGHSYPPGAMAGSS